MAIDKAVYLTIASLFFLAISLLIMSKIAPFVNDNATGFSVSVGAANALFVIIAGAWMRGNKQWD